MNQDVAAIKCSDIVMGMRRDQMIEAIVVLDLDSRFVFSDGVALGSGVLTVGTLDECPLLLAATGILDEAEVAHCLEFGSGSAC